VFFEPYFCGLAVPRIPLIEDLTKQPIPPGLNILVEFDPASQWYNATLTIAAGWMKSGGLVSYNVYAQPPNNIRSQLTRLGLDIEALERDNKFRIIDWYTFQLGQKSAEKFAMSSLKAADLSIQYSRAINPGSLPLSFDLGPQVLRLSDDDLVLLRFNDEKSFIDLWRTRIIPSAPMRNSTVIHSLPRGGYPEIIYKTIEGTVDGIIDVKIEEQGGEVKNFMRIRTMRNVGYDSRWFHLKITDNFKVTLDK
jgi:KaiC/GvpD/RAD55 family RecA-like ATPase